MNRFFTPVLVVSFVCLNGLQADVTTNLTPVADSYIQQFSPDLASGSESTMVSGELGLSAANELRRAFLRFDLSSALPAGATVSAVTIQITVTKVPFTPTNSVFDLRRVLESWDESQITWNSRLTATPWEQPGALGPLDSASGASSSVFVAGASRYTFGSTPALVADVQSWVDNPNANFGWLLISEGEGIPQTARHFATREDTNNAPVLSIIYSAPQPAAAVAVTISPPAIVDNQIQFSFYADSNLTYAVEFRPAFNGGDWQTLTNLPAQAASATIQIIDPITAGGRFYRVRTP